MTHEQEILARAIGHIDEDMILSAHAPRKKVRRVIPVLIAACLIVALVAAFPYLREVINTNSDILGPTADGDVEEEFRDDPLAGLPTHEAGTPITLGGSTLTLTHVTETTATFTLVKTDDTPVYAMIYHRDGSALASTEPDYKDNGVTIRPNTIRLYVDGAEQPVYRLPANPGTYEVVVDFKSVRNGQYPMKDYMGLYAYIGEKQAAVTMKFSLVVPEETTGSETVSEPDTGELGA